MKSVTLHGLDQLPPANVRSAFSARPNPQPAQLPDVRGEPSREPAAAHRLERRRCATTSAFSPSSRRDEIAGLSSLCSPATTTTSASSRTPGRAPSASGLPPGRAHRRAAHGRRRAVRTAPRSGRSAREQLSGRSSRCPQIIGRARTRRPPGRQRQSRSVICAALPGRPRLRSPLDPRSGIRHERRDLAQRSHLLVAGCLGDDRTAVGMAGRHDRAGLLVDHLGIAGTPVFGLAGCCTSLLHVTRRTGRVAV